MNWCDHVQKMNEENLPKKIINKFKLKLKHGRKREGRPRNSWMQELTTGVREKGINSKMDRQGKKKNKWIVK